MPYPLQVQLCMDTYVVPISLSECLYNLLEKTRNESLNSLDYGCEEHSEIFSPSKCIMRCHQTFSDCVSVLACVTNDVVIRVLDLIVYYFVTS